MVSKYRNRDLLGKERQGFSLPKACTGNTWLSTTDRASHFYADLSHLELLANTIRRSESPG